MRNLFLVALIGCILLANTALAAQEKDGDAFSKKVLRSLTFSNKIYFNSDTMAIDEALKYATAWINSRKDIEFMSHAQCVSTEGRKKKRHKAVVSIFYWETIEITAD